jgi:NADH dehydrogenase/NADH:ubiquinone oxidoreductase subunit G
LNNIFNNKNFSSNYSTLASPSSVLYSELNILNICSFLEDLTYSSKKLTNYKENAIIFFLNTANFKLLETNKKMQTIYQGHHGIENLIKFDYILPTTLFLEKNGMYLNSFGELKTSRFVITPPKNARNDVQILHYLFKAYVRDFSSQTNNADFKLIISNIRKQLKLFSPLFSLLVNNKENSFHNTYINNNNIYSNKFFIKNLNKIKCNSIGNFLFQNQLTKLSLNLNLANEEQISYFSTFK